MVANALGDAVTVRLGLGLAALALGALGHTLVGLVRGRVVGVRHRHALGLAVDVVIAYFRVSR